MCQEDVKLKVWNFCKGTEEIKIHSSETDKEKKDLPWPSALCLFFHFQVQFVSFIQNKGKKVNKNEY